MQLRDNDDERDITYGKKYIFKKMKKKNYLLSIHVYENSKTKPLRHHAPSCEAKEADMVFLVQQAYNAAGQPPVLNN